MRKILAGLMATAMVTSICATTSFAATRTSAVAADTWGNDLNASQPPVAKLKVEVEDGETYYFDFAHTYTSVDEEEVVKSLDKVVLKNLLLTDKRYDITLKQDSSALDSLTATVTPAGKIADARVSVCLVDADGNALQQGGGDALYDFVFMEAQGNVGTGGLTADIESAGDLENIEIGDVIECDGQGNPIPLTEKAVGVDKDQNGSEGVQSNKTLYFMVKKGQYDFNNENYWKLKIGKGDNAKIVKAVSDVSKNFSSNLVNVVNNGVVENTSGRNRFIKVELNELYTDTEYKVALDLRLSAKSGANRVFGVKEDSEIKVNDFTFYVKNITKTADNDWVVGINGLMLDPIGNDWNNVTYHDEDTDVAFVRFFGDSDVGKFYAKLSTKWAHEDYAAYFNDQDAFYFEFTGSPKLSSTSRADLQIYNPFTDEDGNETIDPSTATVYQVVDGDLIDVTDSFTYGEAENGEDAFMTRTRFLGSYIICEKPVEEAAGDADIEDIVPSEDVETTTPENNAGGKNPANTGRYA